MMSSPPLEIDMIYNQIEELVNLIYSRHEISGMLLYQLAFDYCNSNPESNPSSGEKLLSKIIAYLTNHCQQVREVSTG